jgi:hypothetical protein
MPSHSTLACVYTFTPYILVDASSSQKAYFAPLIFSRVRCIWHSERYGNLLGSDELNAFEVLKDDYEVGP